MLLFLILSVDTVSIYSPVKKYQPHVLCFMHISHTDHVQILDKVNLCKYQI